MMKPLMLELKQRGFTVRLVSLCEFRRMDSPVQELEEIGLGYYILKGLKYRGASTSTGSKGIGGNNALARNLLRSFIWNIRLKKSLIEANTEKPGLAIVPNDVAYPFDRICRYFQGVKIDFVLIQEGIRFPLPNESERLAYGSNGAMEVFAWGERSASYFRSLGCKVSIVGNPRYDAVLNASYKEEVEKINSTYSLGSRTILYVSNPVDDQGFCTAEQKLEQFRRFLQEMNSYRQTLDLKVLVRLHPREEPLLFEKEITRKGFGNWVLLTKGHSIFALLKSVDCCVLLASTVGLEALLMGTPIAVIKLPKHGYVFDYVSSNAAIPLDLERDLTVLISYLRSLKGHHFNDVYLEEHIANRGNATRIAVQRIEEIYKEVSRSLNSIKI